MIEQAHGNLLQADVDALVNTVNTVGVMGKGIALQFKRAFPDMFRDYAQAAKRQELALGTMHVWSTGQLSGPRFVINFPTKGHWKAGSRLADPPNGAPEAAMMPTGEPRPAMTPGRAAFIQLLAEYSRHALGDASLVEAQTLAYFLQLAGEPLRLDFVGHHYGPYADALRHVLATIEGHFVRGFGDGSASVQQAEPLRLLPGAEQEAAHALAHRPETSTHLSRVLELIEGFETPHGLELLATVHCVAQHRADGDDDAVVAAVRAWSPRRGRMFTPEHITVALDALRSKGWTAALAGAY